MDCTHINIASIVEQTSHEGPGRRFAVWVQGCSIRCKGCCNPDMLDFCTGSWRHVEDLMQQIVESGCEGISILGGEPFDQPLPVGTLAREVQREGLGVVTFSGYTYRALKQHPDSALLLENTDLLKAGPFDICKKTLKKRWIGSTNQHFHFLTDRYKGHGDFDSEYTQGVTINITGGQCTISGSPYLI